MLRILDGLVLSFFAVLLFLDKGFLNVVFLYTF